MALLGSLGTAVYRHGLVARLPTGTLDQLGDPARTTLGGTLAAADRLPAPFGPALADAARRAFTDGLVVTCAVSMALALLAALVVAVLSRRHLPVGWSKRS